MNTILQTKPIVLFSATMTKSGLPKSTRKFIRKEKARIHRELLSMEEQEKRISELYTKLGKS